MSMPNKSVSTECAELKVGTFEDEQWGNFEIAVLPANTKSHRLCKMCKKPLNLNKYFYCNYCMGMFGDFGFEEIHEGSNVRHCELAYWGEK